jgi:hypothetical protein
VADQRHSTRNSAEWYDEYMHWLTLQGWVSSNSTFRQLNNSHTSFEIKNALLSVLQIAIGPGTRFDVMRSLFSTLQADQGSNEYNLFEDKQKTNNGGGFQIGTVGRDSGDHIVMPSIFSAYTCQTRHHNFLWWHWSSESINFYGAFNTMILVRSQWETVKADVQEKLGDLAKKEIGTVGPLHA